MLNMKRAKICTIAQAGSAVANINDQTNNGEVNDKNEYACYFTSIGIIQGKLMDTHYFKTDSEEGFKEEFMTRISEGEKVDVFSIADAYFDFIVKDIEKEKDKKVDPVDFAIYLEDVKIKKSNDVIDSYSHYALFADQVIGMVPGKIF